VPELAKVPTEHLHAPWELGKHELKGYGVVLGESYPSPQVEHQFGRKRALEALASLKAM
jgi:deoxyribodipyrimidine photo-lyase